MVGLLPSDFRRAHKLNATQKAILLDALFWYARQIREPPGRDLMNPLQQLINAAHTATYLLEE